MYGRDFSIQPVSNPKNKTVAQRRFMLNFSFGYVYRTFYQYNKKKTASIFYYSGNQEGGGANIMPLFVSFQPFV